MAEKDVATTVDEKDYEHHLTWRLAVLHRYRAVVQRRFEGYGPAEGI